MNIKSLFLIFSSFIVALVATANADSPPENVQPVHAVDPAENRTNSYVVTDAEKYEIAEAILRDDITSWVSRTYVRIFFLEIDKGDPPAEFLLRFSDISTATVKGISACESDMGMVTDRTTQESGVILSVSNFRKTSDTRILVDTGHYQDMQSASGYTQIYELKDGAWKYAGYEGTMWIS